MRDWSKLDGIALDYPEWRFSIRTSNTEPLLRLNVEAQTEELMKQKFQELTDRIISTGAKENPPAIEESTAKKPPRVV